MTSRSIRWSVALGACAVAAWALVAMLRHAPPAAATRAGTATAEARVAAPELALPDAATVERSPRAVAAEPVAPDAVVPAEVAPQLGELRGRVLLDATFSDAQTLVTLTWHGSLPAPESAPDGAKATSRTQRAPGQSTVTHERLSAQGESDDSEVTHAVGPHVGSAFDFEFGGLVPGEYELGLVSVPSSHAATGAAMLGVGPGRFFSLDEVLVTAGEPTRDPRLDPLDLRGKIVRARYVVVDGYGVPRASAECRAIASATSQSYATSDEHGNVEFVLAANVETIEIEIERHTTCIVRTPLAFGRSVVVVPDRPTHVLHVDPDSLPQSGELSIFVREAEELSGSSSLGRGATWSRFDAAGDAVVAPRRLGPHELEWRLKRPDDTSKSLVDPVQRLEVRAPGEAVVVELVVPAELR
ncbi:MAG: hypothetical protein L6Q99_09460 [Planctomycetes bacterium]|nr:hypothetical protein [Planctomycetota bacterium]